MQCSDVNSIFLRAFWDCGFAAPTDPVIFRGSTVSAALKIWPGSSTCLAIRNSRDPPGPKRKLSSPELVLDLGHVRLPHRDLQASWMASAVPCRQSEIVMVLQRNRTTFSTCIFITKTLACAPVRTEQLPVYKTMMMEARVWFTSFAISMQVPLLRMPHHLKGDPKGIYCCTMATARLRTHHLLVTSLSRRRSFRFIASDKPSPMGAWVRRGCKRAGNRCTFRSGQAGEPHGPHHSCRCNMLELIAGVQASPAAPLSGGFTW